MTLLLHIPYTGLFIYYLERTRSFPSLCIPWNCRVGAGVTLGLGLTGVIISVLHVASFSCLKPCIELSRFEDFG